MVILDTASASNLFVMDTADTLEQAGSWYGGSGGYMASLTVPGAYSLPVSGWARYGISDRVEASGKAQVGANVGVPGLRFNPLQVAVPVTVGARVSETVAIYARPWAQIDKYQGVISGTATGFGSALGSSFGVDVPIHVEAEYAQNTVIGIPVSQVGLTVGVNYGMY